MDDFYDRLAPLDDLIFLSRMKLVVGDSGL